MGSRDEPLQGRPDLYREEVERDEREESQDREEDRGERGKRPPPHYRPNGQHELPVPGMGDMIKAIYALARNVSKPPSSETRSTARL